MDSFFSPRQRQAGRWLLALGLGALLGANGAQAKPPAAENLKPAEAFGAAGPNAEKALKPALLTPSEEMGIDLGVVPQVRLKALDHDALAREDERDALEGRVKVKRFAVARGLDLSASNGSWREMEDGRRLWVGDVVSLGAVAVRLHLKNLDLPAGSELAIYGPSQSNPLGGVVKNGSPLFDPDRHVERFDGAGAPRGKLYTGMIFGEKVRIEYLAPAGAPDELPFVVDSLHHAYLDPVAEASRTGFQEKMAGPCHNDISCFPQWQNVANSVALITVPFAGGTGLCTGQLLNIAGTPDFTPYFLTANHCLSSGGEAAGTEFYWFYQSNSCNGSVPSLGSVPRSAGATLLSTNEISDYSLLMVEGALPNGLFWSGWTSTNISDGTDAVSIHHPAGDFKRISFAEKGGLCDANFLEIDWLDGPTEPGSSGAGVFRADTGQLFGQLFGGPSACGNESYDCYGAFSTTWGRIKTILKPGSDDNSEQNDSCNKAKVLKPGRLNSRIVKVTDVDWFKVSVPKNKTVTVRLEFTHANGDIDLRANSSCSGAPIAASTSSGNGEVLSLQNVGTKTATVWFQVYLDSDTRNSYNIVTTVQ